MSEAVNLKVNIWFTDGSSFQNCTLVGADLEVLGIPFDISKLDKMDNAYLYSLDGAKIYRNDDLTGSVELSIAGLTSTMQVPQEKIDELERVAT
jgi:hypothetical protein